MKRIVTKKIYTYVVLLRIFPRRMLNFVNLETLHRSALKTFYVEHLFTSCVTNLPKITLDTLSRNVEDKKYIIEDNKKIGSKKVDKTHQYESFVFFCSLIFQCICK